MSNRKNFVPLQPQRVQRTPPGTPTPTPNRDDSTIVDPNVSSCRMCNQTDNSEMVQCDKCKGWHHFQCVGVTATVANNPWQCLKCKETGKKKNVKPTDTVQTPTKKKSTEKVPQTTGGQTATKVTQKKSVPISTDNLLTKETQGLTVNTPKGDTQSVKTVQTPEAVPTTNVQSTTKPSDDTNVQSTPSQVQRPKSIEATADVMNISIRSSISSKRRSVLMLEKLTKEKAIQDKLIEDKAKLESEFLQKEYEIRESMTDSEDEEFPDERVETNEYVKDWLQSSTSNPVSKEDILRNLGAMREQMLQKAMDQIRLNQAKIAQEDVPLTAPKRVQFSQTLTDISDDPTDDGTVYVEQPGNSIDQINRPPGYETENQTFDVRTLAGQIKPSTSQIVQEPKPPEIGTRQSNEISSQSSLGTLVHPDHSDTTPYDPETQNQQRLRSIAANFTDWSTQSSQPRVPIMAQNQTQSSVPLQAPTQGLSTVSTTSPFQPSTAPMLIHQPIISLQQSTPISNSQSTAASIYQQSMAHFVGQPIPPFSIPLQSSVYPTNQPPYQQIPPFISNMNLQPPVTAVISLSNPTLHDHTSNSNQPPYIPSFSHQQPIVSPVAHSPFANPYQQAIGDPNATINVNTYGQQLPLTTNQSYIYDAQLNPQQIPPSRLQLAARQTMPKDYPKFNGDPQKWSIFYNAYANCTVTCGLSNGENLSRIERSLEDPARRAVKTLLSRPEAVPEIIETLKILYGRPEASIEAQIQYIRNEPPPKMHKMETFIDFSMSVRNVTTEIEKSGMWQYLWNPQLLQDLVDKLPYQMKMDWGHIKLSTPNSNLSTFSNWLFTRARTACAITLPNSDKRNNKSNPDNHVNTHSKGNDSNKKSPQHPTNSKSKNCQVCNTNSHETRECRKFIGMPLNDRWETVKANKICRICLGNHHVQRCDSKSLCGEAGCMIKHHRLLHNPSRDIPTSITEKKENVHSAHQHNKIVIFRRYIPVTLYGPNGSLNVLAFLDEGSDMTLIESWIVTKLGITGVLEDLFLRWTAKIVRREPNSQSISLKISGTKTNQRQYDIRDVRTVKSLNLPPQTVNIDQLKITYKFLRRIPIESYTDETPKILIGLKDCKLITPTKVRSGEWDEPIAAKTLLGWEIHGANTSSSQVANLNSHTEDENNDENLHRMIEKFFSLENFGVMKPEQTIEALSDKRARQLLESTTKRIGDRFETGLLWKYDDVSLPDSLPMTKRRLESLEKRLQKDPELALLFRSKFHEYIEKGYVRKLSTEEAAQTNERTWYLPLFPVTYPKKPGKIRLVWDAAAKVANVSLNSMLLSGPDMLVSLPGVLYRFRERAFAITGDIKEMFHQIAVRKRDQMSQRFLWKESGSSKVDVYVLEVLSFGATSSPSSAQHVKNRNAREFAKQYPRAEEAIRKNTYVDDWLQSFDTEAEAESVAKEVKYVHSRGGFEIRNWLSSSPNVARNLGENPTEDQKLSFDQQETQTERVLGMWWDVKSDAFTYSLRYNPINKDILFNGKRPTKREALRTLMSIYDPIGLLASYLVQLKMILQDIWRTHIGWDEQIKEKDNDQIYARWLSWIAHLPDIERISIKRHYSNMIRGTNPTKIELHVFTDAGELAYATVAYFRIEDQSGVDVSLIGGKTKVAPLKPLSIPRMELQAAVLGARFKNTLVENHTLKIERIVMWTDSSTVLSWLRSDLRRYTQYVGARVNEILETTKLVEWRWIPSKMNPADDATKYKTSFNLDTNNRWFQGPQFLRKAEQYWPSEQDRIDTTEELRPKYVNAHIKDGNENFSIKFEHFLQWRRTMAFVLRYINNVRASLQKPGFVARYGLLCREELQQGENALIREAQMDAFAQDICKLRKREIDANGRHLPVEKSSPIYRYSPYLDNVNILRMRGRIDAASNVSSDQKRPIILPTNHQITDMIVNEYHSLYKHQNTETVINEIKQRFIIPRLRVLYNKIRRNCQHCKNAFTRPKAPEMAQLPEGRLASFNRTFTFVGIDYAGPYMIMSFRRTVKRWIVVFTCLTVRAVYIDCVESLTTDSCIMAIRRFVARNGPAEKFYSDRGTSFVGANNELKREIEKIDHDLLSTTFTNCYTQWSFNPPYGQHMGGAWERLIRSMKTTLDKTLPKSHYPTHETFITALAEVENIINSRPLTFVSIEADDQEALTPNHFLKGSSNGIKPPGIFPPLPKTLRGNWRYSQQIANEFWKKWLKEYLPMITRRTKWFENVKPVEVGDQVIIVDGDAPRNMWERGVVIEAVKSGQDGCVRRAQVRTVNGIYTRPTISVAAADNLLAIPSDVYQSINQSLELKCLLDAHAEQLNEDADRFCPTSFDSILCWPRTPKGSLATLPCLAELSGVHYDISKNASRFCNLDGNWDNYTNYDLCIHVPESSAVSEFEPNIELPTIVYYIGYSISLISLTLAVAVFIYFKDLRCLRNTIHANLFLTYILSGLLWILTLSLQISGHPSISSCIFLVTLFHYFSLTNFFWMLVEGLYLYMLVVETFSGDNLRFSMYATIGWGGPALFVLSWAIIKAFTAENENLDGLAIECTWMRETNIDWIFQGPACAVLIINLIFLCRIMWVLITKLRSANTQETRQYRKATKALLVLIPLLGITYLVVMAGPNEGVGSYIFAVARALLLSTQGFSVSLFYCFLNSDVRTALRHRFNRWKDERNIRMGQSRQSQRYTATSLHYCRDYSPRSRAESIRPLTSHCGKRESCASSATTTTLLGPNSYTYNQQRDSNGALQMSSTPRAISPLMKGLEENSV